MNQASKTKLRSTLSAIIAALVMFGPDILEWLSVTDASPKWIKLVAKAAGLIIGLATSGKAVAILNKFLPDDGVKPVPPAAVALLTLVGSLVLAGPARADINLDDIAPRLTKCWATTCLQPAASVNAVLFDVSAKKWQAGTTSLGAGLELLFAADQAYGSGIVAHVTGVISQQGPSFAMPTIGVVLLRYAEIGYSYRVASDAPNTSYVSVALTLPWDLVATGKTLPVRAEAARKAARVQPGDDLMKAKDF